MATTTKTTTAARLPMTPAPAPASLLKTREPRAEPYPEASDYSTVWVHHRVDTVNNQVGWVRVLSGVADELIAAGHAVDPYTTSPLPYITDAPAPTPAPSPSPSPSPSPAPSDAPAQGFGEGGLADRLRPPVLPE